MHNCLFTHNCLIDVTLFVYHSKPPFKKFLLVSLDSPQLSPTLIKPRSGSNILQKSVPLWCITATIGASH